LAEPLLNLLDLTRLRDDVIRARTLRRAMRQIASRDLRYRAFELGGQKGRPRTLRVWRQDLRPSPERA
jgi:hypothetical protein